MSFRAVGCLPAIVGAWRERGGGIVHHPYGLFGRALKNPQMPELENPEIRSFNMVQLGRALNDRELEPPVAALFVYSSNPAVTTPDQALVMRGLAREDLFTVVHDQFLTDTARFADYVLPATTQVEHWDLLASWGHTFLSLNRPAIQPQGEARPTTEVFRRLAERLGLDEPYLRQSDEEMIREALSSGHPYLEGITFERLLADRWAPLSLPEPWMPFAEGRYDTPSGKCELYSERLASRGIDPLPAYVPPAPASSRFPLVLLTPKTATHFLNSSYSHLPHHRRAQGELWLDVHPTDAEARGIADGSLVRLTSEHGMLEVRARVGGRVRPGVVAVPSGGSGVARSRRRVGQRPHRRRAHDVGRRRRPPRDTRGGATRVSRRVPAPLLRDAAERAIRFLEGIDARPVAPCGLEALERLRHPLPEYESDPVEVWAALRTLGRQGVAEMIERTCRHARCFAEGLEAAGFEVLNEVVLNQVLVAFGDAATTDAVVSALQAEGTCWAGGTAWQGRPAMRISVSSWATTESDVEESLAAILRVARTASSAPQKPV